jgi:uncharacterized coiled-coil protein SlyX
MWTLFPLQYLQLFSKSCKRCNSSIVRVSENYLQDLRIYSVFTFSLRRVFFILTNDKTSIKRSIRKKVLNNTLLTNQIEYFCVKSYTFSMATDSKKLVFNKTNSYAANPELIQKIYALLDLYFDNDEDRPKNHREFVTWMVDELTKLSLQDGNTTIRDLSSKLVEKNKDISSMSETITELQAEIQKLKGLNDDLEDKLTDEAAKKETGLAIELDQDSYTVVDGFVKKYRDLSPDTSPAQAIANLVKVAGQLQKHTGGYFRLDNGKKMKL